MDINTSSAFYAGFGAIQAGQNRVDQAAQQIASTTSQSTDFQSERLRAVDRSQQLDLATSTVQLALGKQDVELGVKVAKASDELLGRFIDTYA